MNKGPAIRGIASAQNPPQLRSAAAFVLDQQSERQLHHCLGRFDLRAVDIVRGDIAAAIDRYSTQTAPDLLIVDITRCDMPLSEFEKLANVCAPDVNVIAIGERDTVGLYRSLMKYGVSDYLVKPLPADILYQAIKELQADHKQTTPTLKGAKKIAVIGAAGGVGATSITAALADLLSRKLHRRIMLLDLHLPYGCLGLLFGQAGQSGLMDILEAPHRIDPLYIERAAISINSRLDLLFGDDAKYPALDVPPAALEILLGFLEKNYHFILSDIARPFCEPSVTIIGEMDVRLVVIDSSLATLRNAARLLADLRDNQQDTQNLVILNRSRPAQKTDMPLSKMADVLGQPVDFEISYEGRNFSAAALKAQPVSQLKSRAAQQLTAIANSLAPTEIVPARGSIWANLKRRSRYVW